MDGVGVSRKCSSQRCPGKILEIFEKSIDKHKIDAILECAVQSGRFFYGNRFAVGVFMPEDSAEESGGHPDTRIPM